MKIHSFRVGFATNSSSSHSVVLIPADMVGKVGAIAPQSDDHYGWDHFRLVTPEDKLRYLCAQFFSGRGEKSHRKEMRDAIAQYEPSLADLPVNGGFDDLHVDHQSVWGAPQHSVETLVKFFMSPRVVILGGNDNCEDHPNEINGPVEDLTFFFEGSRDDRYVSRMDGDYFITLDRTNGTKVRFSIDASLPDYAKASTPELVDLKITNYCASGCEFCYQSSTVKGKHAPLEDIKRYVDMLADLEVFEVAIGGGEPTDHPDLPEILHYIDSRKIIPNFTTFSDRWLDNIDLREAVLDCVGSIGVSVHNADGLALVQKIDDALRNTRTKKHPHGRWNQTVMAQHVVGSTFLPETANVISKCFEERIPILLLGYKDVGFGKKFERFDGGDVAMALRLAIEGNATTTVSVDTALVDLYPEFITGINAPKALVTSPEGKFSCYIDAVTGKMGPSSYVEPKTMTSVPATSDEFKAVFAGY